MDRTTKRGEGMSEQEKQPWTARQFQADSYTYNWCVEDRDGKDVVLACTKDTAFVLSAAPDLLEALELLLKSASEREPFTDAGMWEYKLQRKEAEDKARAAIAKAKGES
jgi:hypothetical protein